MRNFVFHNPTKVIFGRDTIPLIGAETALLGRKVLLVSGMASSRRSGLYRQVMESLTGAGVEVFEHGGVRPNPVLGHVRQGVDLVRENRVAALVALGGGSVIDTAKAIGAGAAAAHDVWKFFIARKSITASLPVAVVSTLAGSGSEMNGGMVITNEETGQKYGMANRFLYPKVAIFDPTVTFSVPPAQTAYGAVDALAHVLEFYCNSTQEALPVQDRLMEGLLLSIMESCEGALSDPRDYGSRAGLMWAGALALSGLTGAGLGKVNFPLHMLAHSLGGLHDVPHGAGIAAVIPGWLAWQAGRKPDRLARLSERVWRIRTGSRLEMAASGAEFLKNWLQGISCPTCLADLGVKAAEIPLLAENAAGVARLWRMREYSREVNREILEHCGPAAW